MDVVERAARRESGGVLENAERVLLPFHFRPPSGARPGRPNSHAKGIAVASITAPLPSRGPAAGGTTVTITGTGSLTGVTSVTFAGKPGTGLATNVGGNPNVITIVSPAGYGAAPVVISSPGGSSTAGTWYYVGPPTKLRISPSAGVVGGGDTVTITGSGLQTTGPAGVAFGANNGTVTVTNDGSLSVVTPPSTTGASTVPITVTTAGGQTNGLEFTYAAAPTVTINPTAGPTQGNTAVTISSSTGGLTNTESVTFGTVRASFGTVDDGTVVALSPPGAAGDATVTVVAAGGTSTAATPFTYQGPPV